MDLELLGQLGDGLGLFGGLQALADSPLALTESGGRDILGRPRQDLLGLPDLAFDILCTESAIQFVAPDSFNFLLSISLLTGVVIGGLASISGALFGALFIQFVPNVADEISKAAPWAIYGIVLIAFMYVMPTGVAGFISLMRARLRRRRGAPVPR